MKKAGLILYFAISALTVQGQEQAALYAEQLKNSDVLSQAVWGIEARTLDGQSIVSVNAATRMVPASNTKLITTGTALHALGGDFRFSTDIAFSGSIEDGVLDGDLYIVGRGDPTIGAEDKVALPLDTTFARWKAFLDDAGIKRITGSIIGDGRYLDGERVGSWWSYDDLGWDYGAPVSGLIFCQNRQKFSATPAGKVGGAVNISPVYPDTPWMEYSHSALTSKAGDGDKLWYENTPLSRSGAMRGTLAIDRGTRTESCSNQFGELTCAYYFHNYLQRQGIAVEGGYSDSPVLAQDELSLLGRSYSPPLREIVRECNLVSDNLYAEVILRIQGKLGTGSACFDSCYTAKADVLEDLGVDFSGMQQVDGSGLARHNYISPAFFVDFLTAMSQSPAWGDFLGSLPQPGGRGTLSARLSQADAASRSRIYAKSGSMNGVRCYSGYILPKGADRGKTIVFSIMTNNVTASSAQINSITDRLILLLCNL